MPRNSTEVDIGSPMEVESVTSVDDQHTQKAASVISMDDPDVRLAAEALSGLGNPGEQFWSYVYHVASQHSTGPHFKIY